MTQCPATTQPAIPHLEEVISDFQRVCAEARHIEQLEPALPTLEHYAKPETCLAYVNHFSSFVKRFAPDFESSIGIDFGCWYGLSTFVLRRLGARHLHGVDVVPQWIASARAVAEILKVENIGFSVISGAVEATKRVPLPDQSVDWALANDVFSFAHPDSFERLIVDVARVLKPGGRFFLSDANNPHHAATVQRLLATYPRYENIAANADQPEGMFYRMRCDAIAAIFPALETETIEKYARETAYQHGDAIMAYIRAVMEGRSTPAASLFVSGALRPPIHPIDGTSKGAVTDPLVLCDMFSQAGLTPRFSFTTDGLASRHDWPADRITNELDLTQSGRFYLIGVKE